MSFKDVVAHPKNKVAKTIAGINLMGRHGLSQELEYGLKELDES